MSAASEREKTAAAVAEQGALPMPVGSVRRPSAAESADRLTRLLAPSQVLREDEAAEVKSAFQLANEHIRGDACQQCKPSNRIHEMCPEGHRLALAAANSITGGTS